MCKYAFGCVRACACMFMCLSGGSGVYLFRPICQSANLQVGQATLPIVRLAEWPGQFAKCTVQPANFPETCLICNSCQPILFNVVKAIRNLDRGHVCEHFSSKIVTVYASILSRLKSNISIQCYILQQKPLV